MKIKLLIKTFKKVLKYYKKYPEGHDMGICGIASHHIPTTKRVHVYEVFSAEDGYYKNFVKQKGYYQGYLKGPREDTSAGTAFRIAFLKQEIIELQNLLSEGYTDI